MEKGKLYVFYFNKYNFGRDVNEVCVGKYIDNLQDNKSIMIFQLDSGAFRFSDNVHDELNPENNVYGFIEYLADKFQNRFKDNVSVWHEDYEFKISVPRYFLNGVELDFLSKIEDLMNDVLEDWWSVQWHELKYNNIQCKMDSVLISFRIHDVHEIQFRYNDGKN